jgi:hypothetical protein
MNPKLERLITLALTLIGLLSLIAVAQEVYQPGAPMSDPKCIRITDSFDCLEVAPESERVDLAQPSFSNPTTITNPLYPVSDLLSVVMLGHVDDKKFRSETTLLPETRTIEWNGQKIEALVSQYVAYRDGRIEEVALDWYAQADDGSVWYLGEDVADFENGVMFTNEGTWLAGREGPAAMIMPANPQVGNVYRAEDLPYIVLEELSVKRIDQTINGPRGPIHGAIITSELNQAGSISYKILAPGYGEFRTGDGIDVESLALAVPTDALSGPVPAELQTLSSAATDLFSAAQSEDWNALRPLLLPCLLSGHRTEWVMYPTCSRPSWATRSWQLPERLMLRTPARLCKPRLTLLGPVSTSSYSTVRQRRLIWPALTSGLVRFLLMSQPTMQAESRVMSPPSS